MLPQFFDIAELDGLSGTSCSTRWFEPLLLAVVTKSTFESSPIGGIALHHAEGTRNDAIRAAVTDIWLDKDTAEFRAHDRARGTRFEATCVFAVLADVREQSPGECIRSIAAATWHRTGLDKLDVTPGRVAERAGVVIREAFPVETVIADLVPLLAGNFAGLAANT